MQPDPNSPNTSNTPNRATTPNRSDRATPTSRPLSLGWVDPVRYRSRPAYVGFLVSTVLLWWVLPFTAYRMLEPDLTSSVTITVVLLSLALYGLLTGRLLKLAFGRR